MIYYVLVDTQFQDLQWIIDRSTKQFKKNSKRRLSSVLRDFRKHRNFSLLGDYSILWAIAWTMEKLKLPRKRKQFYNACRQSEEFRQTPIKSKWLDTFTGAL